MSDFDPTPAALSALSMAWEATCEQIHAPDKREFAASFAGLLRATSEALEAAQRDTARMNFLEAHGEVEPPEGYAGPPPTLRHVVDFCIAREKRHAH